MPARRASVRVAQAASPAGTGLQRTADHQRAATCRPPPGPRPREHHLVHQVLPPVMRAPRSAAPRPDRAVRDAAAELRMSQSKVSRHRVRGQLGEPSDDVRVPLELYGAASEVSRGIRPHDQASTPGRRAPPAPRQTGRSTDGVGGRPGLVAVEGEPDRAAATAVSPDDVRVLLEPYDAASEEVTASPAAPADRDALRDRPGHPAAHGPAVPARRRRSRCRLDVVINEERCGGPSAAKG